MYRFSVSEHSFDVEVEDGGFENVVGWRELSGFGTVFRMLMCVSACALCARLAAHVGVLIVPLTREYRNLIVVEN